MWFSFLASEGGNKKGRPNPKIILGALKSFHQCLFNDIYRFFDSPYLEVSLLMRFHKVSPLIYRGSITDTWGGGDARE